MHARRTGGLESHCLRSPQGCLFFKHHKPLTSAGSLGPRPCARSHLSPCSTPLFGSFPVISASWSLGPLSTSTAALYSPEFWQWDPWAHADSPWSVAPHLQGRGFFVRAPAAALACSRCWTTSQMHQHALGEGWSRLSVATSLSGHAAVPALWQDLFSWGCCATSSPSAPLVRLFATQRIP